MPDPDLHHPFRGPYLHNFDIALDQRAMDELLCRFACDSGTPVMHNRVMQPQGAAIVPACRDRSRPNSVYLVRHGEAKDLEPTSEADRLVRELVERFSRPLYRQAVALVRDHGLAEDIVQEALIKAWLSFETFRGESSLGSWVMAIGHNTAVSTIRRQREEVRAPDQLPDQPVQPSDSVVADRIAIDHVWGALEAIDPLSRSIITLRDVEGFTYQEIAEITGSTMATVKTRLFRTRRALADSLEAWK